MAADRPESLEVRCPCCNRRQDADIENREGAKLPTVKCKRPSCKTFFTAWVEGGTVERRVLRDGKSVHTRVYRADQPDRRPHIH